MPTGPETEYYLAILDHYASVGAGDFVVSKIRQRGAVQNALFCVNCSTLFVPRVNCKARLSDRKLTITCSGCLEAFAFTQATQQTPQQTWMKNLLIAPPPPPHSTPPQNM